MIIWINGPFGVGKTTLAFELASQIENSFVFDPEEVGFMIRKLTPPAEQLSDFQDYPLWRELVVKMLLHASGENGNSVNNSVTIIVPMTLVNKQCYDEIIDELRNHNIPIKHIALVASKETILERLATRGDSADSWPAQQVERCLNGLRQLDDVEKIDTTNLTMVEVVAKITEILGVN